MAGSGVETGTALKGLDAESRQMVVDTVRQLRERLLTKEIISEFDKKEIKIEFIRLSYLKDSEIKVITHKENSLNIHNRKYYIKFLGKFYSYRFSGKMQNCAVYSILDKAVALGTKF